MGIFKKWAAGKQPIKWLKSLPSGVAGVYKTAVLQPQIDMNKELADYSYNKNLEMWNLQNDYNSPSAQRERMEEAGFNPNYMAGGGASSTGSASPASMPQYNVQAPQYDPMAFYQRIIAAANGIVGLRQGVANIRKTESQTTGVGLDTEYKRSSMADRVALAFEAMRSKGVNASLGEQLYQNRGGYDTIDGRDHLAGGTQGFFHKQRTALDAQIENQKADLWWKENRNMLMSRYGINTSDNPWFRMGFKALDTIGIDPTQWLKSGSEGLSNFMGTKRGR